MNAEKPAWPEKQFQPDGQGPLSGLKVVDLSRLVAGNMLSLQLADFGAEVIKVELLPAGDPLRAWREDGHSAFWKVYGRNKRSLGLDFRGEGAIPVLRRLVAGADVMLESFRPGTLEKMGLHPDELRAANPKLVLVRISGFGQTGPYSARPGFGTLMEAMSGFAARNGFPARDGVADSGPLLPPLALADMIAGLYGAFATVTAIQGRAANQGRGQIIDLSLLEPLASILGPEAAAYQITGQIKPRMGNGSTTTSPRNVWQSRDGGHVAISASTQVMATRLFAAIGRPEMIRDAKFADNEARLENAQEVDTIVGNWIGERDRDEVLALLQDAGVTAGPIYTAADTPRDPHFLHRAINVSLPDADLGRIAMHDIVPRLSDTPGVLRSAAPELGADSRAVLAAAGFAATEIETLIRSGLIAGADRMPD